MREDRSIFLISKVVDWINVEIILIHFPRKSHVLSHMLTLCARIVNVPSSTIVQLVVTTYNYGIRVDICEKCMFFLSVK